MPPPPLRGRGSRFSAGGGGDAPNSAHSSSGSYCAVPMPDSAGSAPESSRDLGDVANALLLRDVSLLPPLSTGRDPVVLMQAAARRWLCGRERQKRQAFIAKLGGSVTDKKSSGRLRGASGSAPAPPPAVAAPAPAPESAEPEEEGNEPLEAPFVRTPVEPPAPAPAFEATMKSQEQTAPAPAATSALPEETISEKVALEAEVAVEVEEMRKRIVIDRAQVRAPAGAVGDEANTTHTHGGRGGKPPPAYVVLRAYSTV